MQNTLTPKMRHTWTVTLFALNERIEPLAIPTVFANHVVYIGVIRILAGLLVFHLEFAEAFPVIGTLSTFGSHVGSLLTPATSAYFPVAPWLTEPCRGVFRWHMSCDDLVAFPLNVHPHGVDRCGWRMSVTKFWCKLAHLLFHCWYICFWPDVDQATFCFSSLWDDGKYCR